MSGADLQAFRVINPGDFYARFLAEGIRPDGRPLLSCRRISTSLGAVAGADGSCSVKVGQTTVLCAVQAEITVPAFDAPDRGFVDVAVNLSPLCSTSFALGKPNQLSLSVAGAVARFVERAGVVDFNDLCIHSGTHVWVLYVDVVCLNYDGNALDATLLAVNGALADLRLPVPILQRDDSGALLKGDLRVERGRFAPLKTGPAALSLTFAQIDGRLIADPNAEEERLGAGLISVVCSERGDIVSVHKPGGAAVSAAVLLEAIGVALARCRTLNRSLAKAVARGRQCS